MIKSISHSQDQILRWISRLYLSPSSETHSGLGTFDLDPTYGRGNFYRKIQKPKMCFDISPGPDLAADVKKADVRDLPIEDESVKSIIFDPPFLCGGGLNGLMAGKYGYLKAPQDVWRLYWQAMCEFKRILKPQGIIVVKCQDFIHGRNQYFSHVVVMNYAVKLGFYPKDLFILLSKTRPRSWNHKNQNHARKFHSYFWVFGKQKRSIGYFLDPEKSLVRESRDRRKEG